VLAKKRNEIFAGEEPRRIIGDLTRFLDNQRDDRERLAIGEVFSNHEKGNLIRAKREWITACSTECFSLSLSLFLS